MRAMVNVLGPYRIYKARSQVEARIWEKLSDFEDLRAHRCHRNMVDSAFESR